jgi:ribosomal protein S12 methylthiotransferase
MGLQKRIVRHRQRSRAGQQVRVLIDGPSSEHELVLRGRLEGQAPDIDSLVYLTDCDPAGLDAGAFIEAEIVGTRDYDLLVRPLSVTVAV